MLSVFPALEAISSPCTSLEAAIGCGWLERRQLGALTRAKLGPRPGPGSGQERALGEQDAHSPLKQGCKLGGRTERSLARLQTKLGAAHGSVPRRLRRYSYPRLVPVWILTAACQCSMERLGEQHSESERLRSRSHAGHWQNTEQY